MKTFEQFLEDKFSENDEIGGMPITKDNCESMLESWFENLDTSELIDYAEEWISEFKKEIQADVNRLGNILEAQELSAKIIHE